jgi:hypothetical protein
MSSVSSPWPSSGWPLNPGEVPRENLTVRRVKAGRLQKMARNPISDIREPMAKLTPQADGKASSPSPNPLPEERVPQCSPPGNANTLRFAGQWTRIPSLPRGEGHGEGELGLALLQPSIWLQSSWIEKPRNTRNTRKKAASFPCIPCIPWFSIVRPQLVRQPALWFWWPKLRVSRLGSELQNLELATKGHEDHKEGQHLLHPH